MRQYNRDAQKKSRAKRKERLRKAEEALQELKQHMESPRDSHTPLQQPGSEGLRWVLPQQHIGQRPAMLPLRHTTPTPVEVDQFDVNSDQTNNSTDGSTPSSPISSRTSRPLKRSSGESASSKRTKREHAASPKRNIQGN